ncbi:MAG: hypothetical protein ACI82Z_001473 [Cellvibrionaceae bacterium]|jgi:hypothetical protein
MLRHTSHITHHTSHIIELSAVKSGFLRKNTPLAE